MRKILLSAILMAVASLVQAETVLLDEDFNGDDYSKSFGWFVDFDEQMPHSSIQSWFLSSATGTYQPWWILRESPSAADKFFGSHSYYSPAGTSNDWLISVPLQISSKGFVLSFDAQSVVLRSGDRLSDLSLFVLTSIEGISKGEVPQTPTKVWSQVPTGPTLDVTTDEWTRYEYSLDDYVGQTVYICFVNNNTDKDLLCIDNVKVSRTDLAELRMSAVDRYTTEQKVTLKGRVDVKQGDVKNWSVSFTDGTNTVVRSGEKLSNGESVNVSADFDIAADETKTYTVTLQADDSAPLAKTFEVSRLTFRPVTRVLLEETTGLWCGNCPIGMFNIESLRDDPAISEQIVPVCVHISGTAPDLMVDDNYSSHIGVTQAPAVIINRLPGFNTFMAGYDSKYNPTEIFSFAYKVHNHAKKLALGDLSVEGDWVTEGSDTIAIRCTARFRPALSASNADYKVGFILTENNVGMDNSGYWTQLNYFSDKPYESHLGGWTDLGEKVQNLRFHDVARAISHYSGAEGSLPKTLDAGEEYTFEYTMAIPDCSQKDGKGEIIALPVCRGNCELTAFVIDGNAGNVVNAARIPMSEYANNRFTVGNLIASSIEDVTAGCNVGGKAEYYDLQGRRISVPSTGVYIVRKDGKAKKIMVK